MQCMGFYVPQHNYRLTATCQEEAQAHMTAHAKEELL